MRRLDLAFRLTRGAHELVVEESLPLDGLTAIFGPSGAGKSTLLRVVAGFEPTGGHVTFDGETWEDGRTFRPPHRRGAVCLFQTPRLFAHLDVAGNLAYAARRAGALADLASRQTRAVLRRDFHGACVNEATVSLDVRDFVALQIGSHARRFAGSDLVLARDEPRNAGGGIT